MDRVAVLFVDDEEKVLDGFRRTLRSCKDWDLLFARSGANALHILQHNAKVGVVVTDIAMPGMGGEELIHRIHNNYPRVMPIVLSGHWDPATSARQLGPYIQFLAKPASKAQLIEAITTAVGFSKLVAT